MSYILLFDFSLTMSDFDEHGWVNPGLATLFLISLYMNFSLDVVFFLIVRLIYTFNSCVLSRGHQEGKNIHLLSV